MNISVEFVFTEEETTKFFYLGRKAVNPILVILPFVGIILILSAAFFYYFQKKVSIVEMDVSTLLPQVVLGIFFLLLPKLTFWRIKKMAKNYPFFKQRAEWTISQEKITIFFPGTTTLFQWSDVQEIVEIKEAYIVMKKPKLAFWLPKHAFKSPEDVRIFKGILHDNGIKIREKGQMS